MVDFDDIKYLPTRIYECIFGAPLRKRAQMLRTLQHKFFEKPIYVFIEDCKGLTDIKEYFRCLDKINFIHICNRYQVSDMKAWKLLHPYILEPPSHTSILDLLQSNNIPETLFPRWRDIFDSNLKALFQIILRIRRGVPSWKAVNEVIATRAYLINK